MPASADVSRRSFVASGTLLGAAALAGCGRRGVPSASPRVADGQWSARAISQRATGARFASAEYRVPLPAGDARRIVQSALDRAAANGGGRVILGPGRWQSDGPLQLRSATNLHLEAGATLAFTPDPSLYLPLVFTRWEGTECWNYSPFLYASLSHDIAITGDGVIDGSAGSVFGPWRDRQGPAQQRLRQMGADAVPVPQRVFGAGSFLRPDFVQFVGCDGVTVSGVTFIDSPFWVLHPTYCRNVRISGVTVRSPRLNNDGVDPDSCTDVLIEGCVFETGDDAVAIKSGRDADGWRVARPALGIVVRNCQMPRAHNGIAIGSEMSGGVRHVHVLDCRMGSVGSALYFKANRDRGGEIGHVTVRNVTVDRADTLIHFTTAYHSYRGGSADPRFHDFDVRGVRCAAADLALAAVGEPTAPLERLTLEDVVVTRAGKPSQIRHVRDLTLRAVSVNGIALSSEATVDD